MENMSRFHIRPARPDEAGLFYTPHPEEDKRLGTHRLLVRGDRVPYLPEQEATAAEETRAASSWTQHYLTGLAVGLGAVAVVGGACFLVRRVRHE